VVSKLIAPLSSKPWFTLMACSVEPLFKRPYEELGVAASHGFHDKVIQSHLCLADFGKIGTVEPEAIRRRPVL
jgi:hypothetical protein